MNPFHDHSREFEKNLYVYPVISRRSRGLSLGINLSLRKECNFDCPYCQVDRVHILEREKEVNLSVLENEIESLIDTFGTGRIWTHPRFQNTAPEYRVLQDISISGDGESTTSKFFSEVSDLVLDLVERHRQKGKTFVPVVITNGTTLGREEVQSRLLKMKALGGGPWVKLDAGSEEEFKRVAETKISYSKILENIISYGKKASIVLQTIQFYFPDGSLSFGVEQMIARLNALKQEGIQFDLIQLYTLARATKIQYLSPISESDLSQNGKMIQKNTGIEVKIYP